MFKSKDKTRLLKHLAKKHHKAIAEIQNHRGRRIVTYDDCCLVSDTDAYSLSILNRRLSDECWDHLRYHELDLSIRDIRMFQHTIDAINSYNESGIFLTTSRQTYKDKINKLKNYIKIGMKNNYSDSPQCIELPILPQVMMGMLRLYYQKINMPSEIINDIFSFFNKDRLPHTNHPQIKEIQHICKTITKELGKLKHDYYSIDEISLYVLVIKYFGDDYFVVNKRGERLEFYDNIDLDKSA